MTGLALRDLLTHRRRLAGTFLAVFIGVSFLAGSLTLGVTLKRNFDTLFQSADAGTDAEIRTAGGIVSAGQTERGSVSAALIERARRVPGVAAVAPDVGGYGQLLGADGTPIGGNGPPRTAGNWIGVPALNAYRLVQGHAPRAPDEVVINRGAAKSGDLRVGSVTTLQTPAPRRVKVVGIATFGSADGFGDGTFTALTTPTAQRLLLGHQGLVSAIRVRAKPGVSQAELVRRLRAVLPRGVEAISGAQLAAEQSDAVESEFLSTLRGVLVAFAAIALLVATFSIQNTLAIVAAQRTRESALLRALGASRGQVARLLATEALLVGVAASVAGIFGGLGMATALKAVFSSFGGALPASGLVLTAGSVAIALAAGILVTLLAGLRPALRAGRVSPLAALRETAAEPPARRRRAALALLLGRPLPGVTGAIARENVRRNPRRARTTASALAVGVGVVVLATVLVSSLKTTLTDRVAATFAGQLAVTTPGFGGAALDPALAGRIARPPQVATAVGIGSGTVRVAGADETIAVADPRALARVVDLGGGASLPRLGRGEIAVSRKVADAHGWAIGSRLPVRFPAGDGATLRVGAIYRNRDLAGDYLLSPAEWAPHAAQQLDRVVYVALARGVSPAAAQRAVTGVVDASGAGGSATVRTRASFIASTAGGLNALLGFVYVMLLLAIVIALMGIANTLSLSVHERTRELGLLRAVGATRRQIRAIVRGESLIVALLGTVAGLAGGVALGALAAVALGIDAVSVPPARLAAIVVVGALAGLLAAIRPARRAARLDVVRAVAAE